MLILLAALCVLTIPLCIIYRPPNIVICYLQRRWPDILWHAPTSSKVVALTIDDGPSEFTSEILQILKVNNATATFFVIGSEIAGREKILQELILSGNETGNHAMDDEPSRLLSDDVLASQIEFVQERLSGVHAAVDDVKGPPPYFRPGSGFFSERMRVNVRRLDYRLVLGSIYPHDAQIPFWRINARHILSMLRPGGIIICHDRRSWTAPMLRRVLPEIRRRGYRVVSITKLLEEVRTQ